MGRKKKTTTETPISQEEIKETSTVMETKKSPSAGTIGYKGNINVKVQRGNKIISNKNYHNTGNQSLFRFLCECLAGNYYDDLRPVKIKLFSGSNSEDISNPYSWITNGTEGTVDTPVATPLALTYTNVAAIEDITDNYKYTVSYEFKIPYTYINTSVYKAAIYAGNENDKTKWSAIFGFLNEDESGWDPIEITNADQQYYTLVLTWTMTISNQGGSN